MKFRIDTPSDATQLKIEADFQHPDLGRASADLRAFVTINLRSRNGAPWSQKYQNMLNRLDSPIYGVVRDAETNQRYQMEFTDASGQVTIEVPSGLEKRADIFLEGSGITVRSVCSGSNGLSSGTSKWSKSCDNNMLKRDNSINFSVRFRSKKATKASGSGKSSASSSKSSKKSGASKKSSKKSSKKAGKKSSTKKGSKKKGGKKKGGKKKKRR